MLKEDVAFRQEWAERPGLGFELVHNVPQNAEELKKEKVAQTNERQVEVVGASGFEPPTSWSRTRSRNTISLARLVLFCVEHADFRWYSAANGLRSDSDRLTANLKVQQTVESPRVCLRSNLAALPRAVSLPA
jgi:hypothetical protein